MTLLKKGEDESYNYLHEKMDVFVQKRASMFQLHTKFKNIIGALMQNDSGPKRDASEFFKAVFGILCKIYYKNLVNYLELLRNSHESLINDTQRLAKSMNFTQTVLWKHHTC